MIIDNDDDNHYLTSTATDVARSLTWTRLLKAKENDDITLYTR